MAKQLLIIALFLLVALANLCSAFVLRPSALSVVGTAKKGQYLWKAQRAIPLTPTIGAVRVSLSKDDCDDRKGECKYGIVFTTNGGETFQLDDSPAAANFCGLGGTKFVAEDESYATVTCPDTLGAASSDNGSLSYSTKVFTFTAGGNKVEITNGKEPLIIGQPNISDIPAATSVYFGDTIATFEGAASKGVYGRNVELTLNNGTAIHAFYKAVNNTQNWEFTSLIPFPMGTESALHVTGATKVMVIAGDSNNFTQAVSVFLGSRWEKIEPVTYSSPLSTYSSTLGTTIYGGLRGRPGLVGMAAGRKRGSEKLMDFAKLHNKVATRMTTEGTNSVPIGNFSDAFINATEFNCVAGGSVSDDDGCASSSYTAILPMGNGSTVFAIYDKLTNGYNPASGAEGEQTLYAMSMELNETKEQKEVDDKLKEEKEAESKRKAAEERRKQAQRDAEERERQKRREKNRADKAKKKRFAKMDKAAVAEAKKYFEMDNDIIIVRNVDLDLIEQERDTFFDAFKAGAAEAEVEEEEPKEEVPAAATSSNTEGEKEAEDSSEKQKTD